MTTNTITKTCLEQDTVQAVRTHQEFTGKLKFASFLMTCLVVCYHCPWFEESYALNGWDSLFNEQLEYILDQGASLAMSYFFAITGYLLMKDLSFCSYSQKIRRRFSSLFVPYLLWQGLYFLTLVVFRRNGLPFSHFLKITFCLERWPLNGPLWYVYAVFLLAIASPLLLVLFKKKGIARPSMLLLILLSQYLFETDNPSLATAAHYGYISNILFYMPYYLIGCYLGRFSGEHTKQDVLLCLITFLFTAYFFDDIWPNFFLHMTVGLLPLLCLYVLPLAPGLQNKKLYRLSFLMYAIHAPLLHNLQSYLLSDFIFQLPMSLFARNLLVKTLALSLDMGLAFLIHTVLKRFCPKLLTAITGGRA